MILLKISEDEYHFVNTVEGNQMSAVFPTVLVRKTPRSRQIRDHNAHAVNSLETTRAPIEHCFFTSVAVPLVAHVPTVVVAITYPRAADAVAVVACELRA